MIESYPDKFSLKQVFDTELSFGALKDYCRKHGIFLLSGDSNAVTTAAHLFYWGYKDVNSFSSMLEDSKNYKKSFQIAISNTSENAGSDSFDEFYSSLIAYKNSLTSSGDVKFESLTLSGENSNRLLQGNVVCTKRKPGRVKLLDEIPQRFTFEAHPSINNSVIVDVIFDERGSVQAAKKVIGSATATSSNFRPPMQISLNSLTTREKVDLFDRFFRYSLTNWRVDVVRSIKLEIEDNELDEDDPDALEGNFLIGIKTAIFSGTSLRQNPIIIDAVSKGYFFPKATVMLDHLFDATKLLLEIAFNGDDKLLELSVVQTYEVEDEREFKRPLMEDDQKDALKYFHGVIAKIYDAILQERRQKPSDLETPEIKE